jgi:hypothetical protein
MQVDTRSGFLVQETLAMLIRSCCVHQLFSSAEQQLFSTAELQLWIEIYEILLD